MKNSSPTNSQNDNGPQAIGFSPWKLLKTKRISYLTLPLLFMATVTEFVILATGWKYQQVVCLPQGMGVTFFGIASGAVPVQNSAAVGASLEAPVPAAAAAIAEEARTLVHAVRRDRLGRRIDYRFYRLRVDHTARQTLRGELVEVRSSPPTLPTPPPRPPRPLRLPIDHVMLLDAEGLPLAPALPLPVEQDVAVPLALLSNDVEDRVLLIPSAPMAADARSASCSHDGGSSKGRAAPPRETLVRQWPSGARRSIAASTRPPMTNTRTSRPP